MARLLHLGQKFNNTAILSVRNTGTAHLALCSWGVGVLYPYAFRYFASLLNFNLVTAFIKMFKKFTKEENISSTSQVKSSVQRGIRKNILEQYPKLESEMEFIFPKKTAIMVAKCTEHINLIVCNTTVWFFNVRDGPYFPTLRTLHKYPDIMPKVQCDTGAIKHLIGGANCMCPGLTSKGGYIEEGIEAETPVAVMAEGMQHALAVGIMKMSGADVKKINKGVALELVHFLNDGLWHIPTLE